MPVDPEDIETGSIVWAIVRDRNGFRKRRPAIVLNVREDIAKDLPLVLMAITTTFADPAPANCVELPWNNDRRKVGTGLARRSAAVMDWLDTVYLDEVDEVIGVVPKRIMERIHARLRDSGNA